MYYILIHTSRYIDIRKCLYQRVIYLRACTARVSRLDARIRGYESGDSAMDNVRMDMMAVQRGASAVQCSAVQCNAV